MWVVGVVFELVGGEVYKYEVCEDCFYGLY